MNEVKMNPDSSFDMDHLQATWDSKYEKVLRSGRTLVGERWLAGWLHLVPPMGCRRALDMGCGSGQNTRLLLDRGFEVTAIDISERALELCKRMAPEARVQRADVREGLPFAGDCFELIVADLSLHYFPWDMTDAIFKDLASQLVPGGLFAGRFNSARDADYGAGTGEPVRGDSNLLIVDGIEKRFFTRECFHKLFGPPWKMVALGEKTTSRFGSKKMLWEVAATKCDANSAEPGPARDGESGGELYPSVD